MLEALRLVHALHDPLRPQMHNQFKIIARSLERRWKNGGIDTERTMNGFTQFKPSKEGQGWKGKKELVLRRVLAYLSMLQLRLHLTHQPLLVPLRRPKPRPTIHEHLMEHAAVARATAGKVLASRCAAGALGRAPPRQWPRPR